MYDAAAPRSDMTLEANNGLVESIEHALRERNLHGASRRCQHFRSVGVVPGQAAGQIFGEREVL